MIILDLDFDHIHILKQLTVSEFNEFEPRLKFAKNRFQFCTGLNLETMNTIFGGTNHI